MRHSLAVLALALSSGVSPAQGAAKPETPTDSAIARARQLMMSGKDADGRRVLDSLLAATTPDSAGFAEILYWHGASSPTAAEAERDYRRLLIEAPLSDRAEDALLQLAQLQQARGDRRGASDHLQRHMLLYPSSPSRARVSVQLMRLLFDQGPQQVARACDVLRTARAEIPASAVELRNQVEANVPRCTDVASQVAMPIADSVLAKAPADSAKPPVAAAPTAVPAAANAGAGVTTSPPPVPTTAPVAAAPQAPATASPAPNTPAFYSVQVAAYESQESATRMMQQLVARGIDARVDGAGAPYRVRIGKYATRADAVKAQADLKSKGHSGFITLVAPTAK